MAKLSSINKNNRRIKLSNRLYTKRKKLKKIIMDKKKGAFQPLFYSSSDSAGSSGFSISAFALTLTLPF